MKTSNKILVALLGVIMTMILSFVIVARMNAEVRDPADRQSTSRESIQGNGQLGQDLREVASFYGLVLHANMDVEVSSAFDQLIVEAEDNIFDRIATNVDEEDGRLHIHWKDGPWVHTTLPIKVKIPYDSLSFVMLNDRGFITIKDTITADTLRLRNNGGGDLSLALKVDHLEASIQGSGNIGMTGSATHLSGNIHGSGDLDAFDLVVQTAHLHTEGGGRSELQVLKTLKGTTHGGGNVLLKGSANTEEFNERNGRLVRIHN